MTSWQGDYLQLKALRSAFYGTFSADNAPVGVNDRGRRLDGPLLSQGHRAAGRGQRSHLHVRLQGQDAPVVIVLLPSLAGEDVRRARSSAFNRLSSGFSLPMALPLRRAGCGCVTDYKSAIERVSKPAALTLSTGETVVDSRSRSTGPLVDVVTTTVMTFLRRATVNTARPAASVVFVVDATAPLAA